MAENQLGAPRPGGEVLLLSARRMDFVGKDGRPVKGIKIEYTDAVESVEGDFLGWNIAHDFIPLAVWRDIGPVLGVYETLETRAVFGGKSSVKLVGLRYAASVKVEVLERMGVTPFASFPANGRLGTLSVVPAGSADVELEGDPDGDADEDDTAL